LSGADGWTRINKGAWFATVGLLVAPGDTRELTAEIPTGAQAGQYRISVRVGEDPPLNHDPVEAVELSAPFQIR